jgi:membrane fusion protein, multidrug efflux system
VNDSSPANTAAYLSVPGSAPAVQPPPSPQGSTQPPPAAPPPNRLRRVIVRAVIVGLAVLAGGLFMVDWDDLLLLSPGQRTDDAYLRGDPTTLSARVSGYVHRVAVADMETVKEGQVLYEIDDAEYRAQVDLARARLAEAGARVAIAAAQIGLQERQIDVTQSNADLAQSDLIQAEQEQSRQNGLRGTPAFLLRIWEQATQNALALQATVAGNRAIIASQTAQLKVLQATFEQTKADLRAKQAALQTAQINLGYTRVLAPRDGRLGFRITRVGQYVAAGAPLIVLVPRNDVWVVANFREAQVRDMRVGQPARLTFDAYPGITLVGHIDSFEPGSEALGSLLPPDRAVGNFTKIAQRVPVKIRIDAGQARQNKLIDHLLPGLSVEAAVDTAAAPAIPPTAPPAQSAPASPP